MIRGGLSSVSYRNAEPKKVIELAQSAALGGIEWTADTHAPHGDLRTAETLMMATLRAGLTITSYGSFYRIGHADRDRSLFAAVLETARRLQAPAIRVWAPARGKLATEAVVGEGSAMADEAGRHGITICVEPHEKSLIDDYALLSEILERADHPFLKACWSQLPASTPDSADQAAQRLGPRMGLVHVRNWTNCYDRKPIEEEDACWTAISGMAEHSQNSVLDRWAVIEYLEDERPETLRREAEALAARLKG